jgi:thymidylate synthase
MLKVRDGRLEWTQIMRSNDLYRGLPYNLIQFTTLQEILAGWIKVPMGTYAHFTDSLHLYEADRLASSISGTAPNNTDSLAVSEHDLQDILVGGKQLIDTVRCASTEKELYSALPIGVPVGWRNLFLVLMVEVARKKKMGDVQQALLEACTNPVLSTAIVNWNNHLNSKKTRAFQVRQEASVI